MIHDQLKNIEQHAEICSSVKDAIAYLIKTDLKSLEVGKFDIDGKRIFAIVEKYQPKQMADAVWETHKRYIDIQVIITGSERMGYLPLTDKVEIKTAYNEERDFTYYNTDGELFVVSEGEFAIYEPLDVHAPGLLLEPEGGAVHKIVMKCLID